jgi:predicted DNA-binding transcriptional regulator AlpA
MEGKEGSEGMKRIQSPLIKVREASEEFLLERPQTTYDKVARGVFPIGVVVFIGDRAIRFHRENLIAWLAAGGSGNNVSRS